MIILAQPFAAPEIGCAEGREAAHAVHIPLLEHDELEPRAHQAIRQHDAARLKDRLLKFH